MTEPQPRRGPRPVEFSSGERGQPEADADRDGRSPSDSSVPVWMLDVDGVLNAFDAVETGRFRTEVANGYLITWDSLLTDRIHRLHSTGSVEVRWLTTWAELANTHIVPMLGWSELVVAGRPDPESEWWKLSYAVDVVDNERRRLVWTDDDLRHSRAAMAWLRRQVPQDVLAICPDPSSGLTHEQLDRIEEWL